MRILQVGTYDRGGGAEAVAWQLLEEYRRRGHKVTMAVGEKHGTDPDVSLISGEGEPGKWGTFCRQFAEQLLPLEGKVRGVWQLRRALHTWIASPKQWHDLSLGKELFDFPDTWHLLASGQGRPDVVHCHNLHGGWLSHGGYFDLRALPWLSRQVPTVVTLHDTWLLSGHCAYTLGCERWKSGCGDCPDLTVYPAISRDATAYNWRRKKDIYARSSLFISTPSRWLMAQVEQSMLAPAIAEARVIPNGVDLTVFCPGKKEEARAFLQIPQQDKVLLFVANAAKSNVFKDFHTIHEAALLVGAQLRTERIRLIVLGESAGSEHFENGEIRFVPFEQDRRVIARYYRAADVHIHAAKSDTFPNTVIEARACGTPTVATAVDGIPEQVEEGRTGFLVPAGDVAAMAARIEQLLMNDVLRAQMGAAAAETAARLFDLRVQAVTYLEWYQKIIREQSCTGVALHAS
jgi:glycosyltransferase involved in cell wall biosynthesis